MAILLVPEPDAAIQLPIAGLEALVRRLRRHFDHLEVRG